MHKAKVSRKSEYTKAESTTFDAFSIWVRQSYSINDMVRCYTCGAAKACKGGIHGIHAGHYVSRKNWKLMFHFDNVRPQCYECNVKLGGNRQEFEKRLNIEKGYDFAGELLRLSNTIDVNRRSIEALKALAKEFRRYPKEKTWLIGGKIYPNIADFKKHQLIEKFYSQFAI